MHRPLSTPRRSAHGPEPIRRDHHRRRPQRARHRRLPGQRRPLRVGAGTARQSRRRLLHRRDIPRLLRPHVRLHLLPAPGQSHRRPEASRARPRDHPAAGHGAWLQRNPPVSRRNAPQWPRNRIPIRHRRATAVVLRARCTRLRRVGFVLGTGFGNLTPLFSYRSTHAGRPHGRRPRDTP